MLKYFGHNSVFFDFRTTRRVVVVREVVGQGGGGQGGGGQGGGGVSQIGAGIILSAFCSLALFCFMFKVVFIVPVSVHGPEFKRSECMYLIS